MLEIKEVQEDVVFYLKMTEKCEVQILNGGSKERSCEVFEIGQVLRCTCEWMPCNQWFRLR